MVILSLSELCRPFVHQTTFITILPVCRPYLEILESPVPFVCGVLKSTKAVFAPQHCVVIDLDLDSICETSNLPELPDAEEIARQINNLLTNDDTIRLPGNRPWSFAGILSKKQPETVRLHPYKVAWMYEGIVDQYNLTPKMIDNIIEIFGSALNVEKIVSHFLVTDKTDETNPITTFNKSMFLESLTEKQREFFQEFLGTMTFTHFLHDMVDALDSRA
jgi:hypothetical protein